MTSDQATLLASDIWVQKSNSNSGEPKGTFTGSCNWDLQGSKPPLGMTGFKVSSTVLRTMSLSRALLPYVSSLFSGGCHLLQAYLLQLCTHSGNCLPPSQRLQQESSASFCWAQLWSCAHALTCHWDRACGILIGQAWITCSSWSQMWGQPHPHHRKQGWGQGGSPEATTPRG